MPVGDVNEIMINDSNEYVLYTRTYYECIPYGYFSLHIRVYVQVTKRFVHYNIGENGFVDFI